MSSDVDPSTFGTEASDTGAAAADPERQPELEPGGRHALAEGHAEPTSSTDALWEALSSTDPNVPLEQVESPWNPTQGGPTRIFRAVQKMTGTDALPAWADLLIGSAEFAMQLNNDTANTADGSSGGTDPDIQVVE